MMLQSIVDVEKTVPEEAFKKYQADFISTNFISTNEHRHVHSYHLLYYWEVESLQLKRKATPYRCLTIFKSKGGLLLVKPP